MRVLSISTINGIYPEMIKSFDSEKHHALMELRPEGVLVFREKLGWALVPFTNIAWMRVDPATAPVAKKVA